MRKIFITGESARKNKQLNKKVFSFIKQTYRKYEEKKKSG